LEETEFYPVPLESFKKLVKKAIPPSKQPDPKAT
jgi:hypothetical protein